MVIIIIDRLGHRTDIERTEIHTQHTKATRIFSFG